MHELITIKEVHNRTMIHIFESVLLRKVVRFHNQEGIAAALLAVKLVKAMEKREHDPEEGRAVGDDGVSYMMKLLFGCYRIYISLSLIHISLILLHTF